MLNLGKNVKNAPAKVVGGRLVLSFPDARQPVLWQMALEETRSSAFEITQAGNDSAYALVMKKGEEKQEIASFADKDSASEALMAIGRALENPEAATVSVSASGAATPSNSNAKGALKFLASVFGILVIIGLVMFMMSQTPRPPAGLMASANTTGQQADANANPQASGEPVSADAFLRGF